MRSTIHTTVAALAAVAALTLTACGDSDDDPGDDTTAASEESAEETPAAEDEESEDEGSDDETADGESADVFDVGLGECIQEFDAEEEISDLTVIPCEQEHDQEVFAVFEVADGDFPGEDAFKTQVEEDCVAEFATFVGVDFYDSELDIQWLEPTEDSWGQGDRELVCTILDPAGPTTGTLADANR